MSMIRIAAAAAVLLGLAQPAAAAGDTMVLTTNDNCDIVMSLRPDLAPNHVAQMVKLTQAGFFNGVVFHRVIDGFMAQTGDPTGTGTGGSKEPDLKAEFSKAHYARGTVGMARSQDPNSANSQFFIMLADGGFLDGQYTVWAEVKENDEKSLACLDQVAKGEPPPAPDKIVKMEVR